MRILQVNTVDRGGGAAEVAWNLFTGYRARGHASWLAVGLKRSSDPDVFAFPNGDQRGAWAAFWWRLHTRLQPTATSPLGTTPLSSVARGLARSMAEPARAFDYFRGVEDFHFPATRRMLALCAQPPDVVHTHNLHGGYFDLRALPLLSQQRPLLLTLHDAWLLSGHCSHSFKCERWKTGCGRCPDLTIPPAIRADATARNWRRKRELYARSRLHVATPSRWLMQKVEQSALMSGIVEARVVPNGVDLTIFQPTGPLAVRGELNIPHDAVVLAFAAENADTNRWKDFDTVRQAARLAADWIHPRPLLLLVVGGQVSVERAGNVEIRSIPYQREAASMARHYQAADVYVHAAHVDTFPQTVLEAQACGTPVVATAVGGIPEQILDGRTGFLAPPGDAPAMARYITTLVTHDALRNEMAHTSAEMARQSFDLSRQIDTYVDWYQELVERRTGVVPATTALASGRR